MISRLGRGNSRTFFYGVPVGRLCPELHSWELVVKKVIFPIRSVLDLLVPCPESVHVVALSYTEKCCWVAASVTVTNKMSICPGVLERVTSFFFY